MQQVNTPLSLAVSPGLISVDLKPGEVYEGEFFITNPNLDGKSLEFSVAPAPLTFENEFYDLSFSERDDYNQIVDWIEIEEVSGALEVAERRAIKFKITVPSDAPAGGQYASFLVSPVTPTGTNGSPGVSIENKSRVAVLLYTTVEGNTVEEGTVLENNVGMFYFNQPIKTTSLVENTGNVHLPVSYVLRVFPLFSNEEVYTNDEAPKHSVVIPDTTLYSEKTWEETPLLGLFRVQQDIDFGDRIDRTETLVLVAPTWFICLALVFLASVIFTIVERIRKYRRLGPKPEPEVD